MDIRPCKPKSKCPKGLAPGATMCVCKCPCGSKGKYRQPLRPKSFAPVCCYNKPEIPIEACTIYKKSYCPTKTERPIPIIPPTSLEVSKECFAKDTIQKMSYRPNWGFKPPPSNPVCCHNLMGDGPMQEITTTRHDYVPKPIIKSEKILPTNNIFTTTQPISDKTINRLSYQPIYSYEKALPVLPRKLAELPQGPISGLTIQKCSYQPVPIPAKEPMPWADKGCYQLPTAKMAGDTIYKKSYLANCVPRQGLILPESQGNPLSSGGRMEGCTIYKASYLPTTGTLRPEQIVPKTTLCLPKEKMAVDTINKMSYRPNWGFKPPPSNPSCSHNLLGEGPMQEITTTRHDYVPKPICVVAPIKQSSTIPLCKDPISNKTINRLSYLPNATYEISKPILPKNSLETATGKIETCTIQKMSYQPVRAEKIDMPWAAKGIFCPPTTKMAGDTIYGMSYEAPGQIMGDDTCTCTCALEALPPPPCEPCLKPIFA